MSDKRQQETRRMAEAAESEIDREFETASLAMMRAFEAFQRYEAGLEDVGVEEIEAESRWLASKYEVAVSMHMILRAIGVSPTGPMAARVVRKKLDECDLERCVIDRVAHPPTRKAVIAGLTATGRRALPPDGRVLQGPHRQRDGRLQSGDGSGRDRSRVPLGAPGA